MSLLPKHVESMHAWLDSVEEVVAVDSHSHDGTLEFLERELQHPRLRIMTHPPGLYQSWNFGIAQCRAKYLYISTVGETIGGEGLSTLCSAAERFAADVVISPPRMIDMHGGAREKEWPIHGLISTLHLQDAFAIDGVAAQVFAVCHLLRGILGSSASNLYRADILRQFPFRTDFGTAGDLAWGLEHAGRVRFGIVPVPLATFVFHPKSYAKSEYAVSDFVGQCVRLAEESVAGKAWMPGVNRGVPELENLLRNLLDDWRVYLATKATVQSLKSRAAWFLNPGAWIAHRERTARLRRLERTQDVAMRSIASAIIRQ